MGETLRSVQTPESIDDFLSEFVESMSENEIKNAEQVRSDSIQELNEKLGVQKYGFGIHSGTIQEMIDTCSAIEVHLSQGAQAVIDFVTGFEISEEEYDERQQKKLDDLNKINEDELTDEEAEDPKADEPTKVPQVVKTVDSTVKTKKANVQVAINRSPTPLPELSPIIEKVAIAEKAPIIREHKENEQITAAEVSINQTPAFIENQINDADRAISTQTVAAQGRDAAPRLPAMESKPQPQQFVEKIEATFTPLQIDIKSERVTNREVVETPVERIEITEIIRDAQQPERIDNVEPAVEVFHIPTTEIIHIDDEPFTTDVSSSGEIVVEIDSGIDIDDTSDDESVAMDMAVEEIMESDEIADQELAAIDTNDSDLEIPDDTEFISHSETEPVPSSLQTVLERQQSEEIESVLMQVETEQHNAIVATIVELVDEMPVEKISYDGVAIQNHVATVAEHISTLEKSKNEQECREAIIGLRKELKDLLTLLGYQDVDSHVERIIRNNHDMSEIKRIMETLLRAAIVDESITDNIQMTVRPQHKFGQWVVGRTTTLLQAA